MDNEASPPRLIQRRRRYSREFKDRILAECLQSGESVAGVAIRHGLNPNMVQKWRKARREPVQDTFLRLTPPVDTVTPLPTTGETPTTIRMELPTPQGQLVVHWPVSQLPASIAWLRALTQ